MNQTQLYHPGISGLILAREETGTNVMIIDFRGSSQNLNLGSSPTMFHSRCCSFQNKSSFQVRKVSGKVAFLAILPHLTSPQTRRMKLKESAITSCVLICLIPWRSIWSYCNPFDFGILCHSMCLGIVTTCTLSFHNLLY